MGVEDLNSFADSVASPNKTGLRTSLNSAADIEPDAYAELKKSARRLHVPTSLLPPQKADRRRLEMVTNPFYSDLHQTAPQTAKWLSDPENAKLAHDDVENLSGIEKWFTEYVKKPAASTISSLGMGVDVLAFPLASMADYLRGDDKYKETLSQRIAKFQEQQKAAAPEESQGFVGRLGRSLVELAPYLAMGPAGPAILAGQATAGKGVEKTEQGVKGTTLSGLSALSGITAFAMTKLPFAGKPAGSMVKGIAKGAARGAIMNPILGAAERATEKGVLNATGYKDAADQTKVLDPGAIAEDMALGILFGAHGGYEARKAHAEQNTAAVIAVSQMFKDSKLRQRDAESLRDHVNTVAVQTGLEHVGMPVERFEEFFQSIGKRPEDILTDPNAYYEAKATGSDVIIPMGDFAANMAEHVTPEHAKDIRKGLGADTQREIEEAQGGEEIAAEEFRATVEKEDKEAIQAPERRVYDDVLGQLLGLHIPQDVAEKQASLWAIRARTRGARLDMDPWELYKEKPLEVVRGDAQQGEAPQETEVAKEYNQYPVVSPEDAKAAKSKVLEEMAKVDPDSDRATQLDIMLDQYNDIISGKAGYSDFQAPALFQPGDEKRGYIRIGDQKIQIGLLEKADLSTFLHETGHAFLEEMSADALREKAPDQIKEDFQKIKEWAGIEGDSISTEAHEKFASAIEDYFKDGKAPSQELMPLFQRFAAWIKQVYRKLSGEGVKVPQEIREVMDRMLATDEEIERAEDLANLRPIFATAADAGMTEAEFSAYRKVAEKAHAEHSARLLGKMMEEVTREQKAWWKEERAKMVDEVTSEAKEDPAFQAFSAMTKGEDLDGNKLETPVKLDRAALVKMYGESFVAKLPRAFSRMYAKEGGVHPDIAAEIFGFGSGDEMIQKMVARPKMKEWIASEVKARMLEKFGDMQHDGSAAEEALKAVHGDETGELLRAELKAIERKRKEVKPFKKADKEDAKQAEKEREYERRWMEAEKNLAIAIERGAKDEEIRQLQDQIKADKEDARQGRKELKTTIPPLDYFKKLAAETIGGKALRGIKPGIYARAESKAGREALDAAAKQDFDTARDAQVRRLTNHYLYMEAIKAHEEAEKIVKYMKNADNPKTLGKVGKASDDLLKQIQSILSRYEFKKIPFSALDEKESLRAWIDRFESEHEDRVIPIDDQLLDESYRQNYRTIPMDELRSVHDAVKAIIHAATAINYVQAEGRKVMMEDAADSLMNAPGVASFKPDPYRPTDESIPRAQKIFRAAKKLNAGLRREEFLFELLDGGTEGPWHDFFWNGYLRSENRRREVLERIHEPIKKAMEEMPKEQKDRLADKSLVHIKSLKADLSRNELFSILLNFGNESNEDKMVRGGFMYGDGSKKLTEDALHEILGTFTKADFDAAQTLWDAVNTVWPDITDLQKRWTGLEPAKVDPRKLVTDFGEYAGGYWPVKYDPRGSSFGEKQDDTAKSVQDMAFRYKGKSTQKGHTIERTEAAAPILLDWKTVATRHMNDVATDIGYREWASDARRLLKREDLKNEMQLRLGKTEYDNMRHWLDSTIAKDSWGTPGTAAWENIYRAGYKNFTTAVLGANLAGAFADVSVTPLLAATRIGPKHLFNGYREFLSNPRKVNEFIKGKSDWHARIEENVDQSLRNSLDYIAAHPSKWSNLMAMTLNMRVWMYHQAANATWIGAYREAIAQGKTDIQAVRVADKVPRMTQHSGDVGSLSALERHPFWKKLLVYAGPVEVAYNAMVNAAHDIKASKGTDPAAWGKLMAFWFGQSVLWAAVRGKKDKDESWGGFVARHMMLGPLEAFPIMRDAVGYTEKKLKGQRAEMQALPILSIPKSVADALSSSYKYAKGEGEAKQAIKDINVAAGMTTGYPAFQVDITGQFLYDVLSGQYQPKHPWSPLHDAIYRRKKE